jgi:hypothetical protein
MRARCSSPIQQTRTKRAIRPSKRLTALLAGVVAGGMTGSAD